MLNYIELLLITAQMKLREFCTKEDGDVNVVSIVVLIGIAVVLAVLFRGRIEALLNTLFGTIEQGATDVIS